MRIAEAQRLELHLKLKHTLGDDMADVLMEHLPPAGWGDLARRADLDQVAAVMEARFTGMDRRFEALEARMSGVVQGLWALGSLTSAFFLALLTIIVTKL